MGVAVSGGGGGQNGPSSLPPADNGPLGPAGETGRGTSQGHLLTHTPHTTPEGGYIMSCIAYILCSFYINTLIN